MSFITASCNNIPPDRHYLTNGKEYKVHEIDDELIIVDDDGDAIPIKPKKCHYLDGGDWTIKIKGEKQ